MSQRHNVTHWPDGIRFSRHGKIEHQPAHLIDVMPTLCDNTRAVYPSEFKGHKILPMQGVSLMLALQGNEMPRVQPIFWMHEGNRAVRSGPWKAVKKFREPWELYNIELDRTELNNLALKEPALLQHFARQWEQWALASYVDEWDGNFRTNWGAEIQQK